MTRPEQMWWDSESRKSPYCTVWSPEQDMADERVWDEAYDEALGAGMTDEQATAWADDAVAAS